MILGHRVFRKKMRGLDKFIHWAHGDLAAGLKYLMRHEVINREQHKILITLSACNMLLTFILIALLAIWLF